MTAITEWGLQGHSASFSFYLTAPHCERQPGVAISAGSLAHTITIAGPGGPAAAVRLRASGFEAPILFDGTGYARNDLPSPDIWISQQANVGASRYLLPGIFVPWDKNCDDTFEVAVQEQSSIASDLGATMLLAVDARWIAKRTEVVVDSLQSTDQAVALVLAHRADPLSVGGAVPGLRRISQRVSRLTILRSDHGAIGALAFGAEHAAIGLTTTTRHYATAAMRARRRPGLASRVFVSSLFDWFLADDIAGWTAAGSDVVCDLQCCGGLSLAQFIDPDLDVNWHNMHALAHAADYVLGADTFDRPRLFLEQCRRAVSLYGLAGFKGPENPKPQLTSWVLS